MGALSVELGVYPDAETYYQDSLNTAFELGERFLIANAIGGLGDVARARGDNAEAGAKYHEALIMFSEIIARPLTLHMLVSIARLHTETPTTRTRGLQVIGLVRVDATLNAETLVLVDVVERELSQGLDQTTITAALDEGAALDVDTVVRAVLGRRWF